MVTYSAVSSLTLPFLDKLWVGDLPVLAVVQLPKMQLTKWLMHDAVIPLIRMLGLSPGSASPEYAMAGPYALVAAYLIPLGLLLLILWIRTRFARPLWMWAWLLVIFAAIDIYCTWSFS